MISRMHNRLQYIQKPETMYSNTSIFPTYTENVEDNYLELGCGIFVDMLVLGSFKCIYVCLVESLGA